MRAFLGGGGGWFLSIQCAEGEGGHPEWITLLSLVVVVVRWKVRIDTWGTMDYYVLDSRICGVLGKVIC